ncbi:MAG: hypothetical protein JXR69_00040 [Candidatus Delongbacteria bacterium]|nr:hypothetical protein [Candidatus Delongbacteria bacterium]
MKNKRISIIVMILGFLVSMYGQAVNYNGISGIMLAQNDDTAETVETEASTPRIKSKKKAEYKDGMSPMIASGLSILLPGAGEFYAKDYIRSGIFFGIEAVAVSLWYVYDSDGDDKTAEFEDYANSSFSEDRYYGGLMGMSQNFLVYLNANPAVNAVDIWSLDYFKDRDNWYWDDDIDWDNDTEFCVLDMMEMSMTDTSLYYLGLPLADVMTFAEGDIALKEFTHNLPSGKTQQYYEMIGKYHQFAGGWDDYEGYERDAEGEIIYVTEYAINGTDTTAVLRPKLKLNESSAFNFNDHNSAEHVDFYEDLRNEANIAYEMGQNFLMVTLLNHVASAFDAAYVIKSKYSIETKLRIENNDKADVLGLDNYKLTYSVNW